MLSSDDDDEYERAADVSITSSSCPSVSSSYKSNGGELQDEDMEFVETPSPPRDLSMVHRQHVPQHEPQDVNMNTMEPGVSGAGTQNPRTTESPAAKGKT